MEDRIFDPEILEPLTGAKLEFSDRNANVSVPPI